MDTDQKTPEQVEDDDVAAPANGAASGPSILDGIAEMRRERVEASERQLDIDIPGYESRLAVIYRYPEGGYERAVKAVEHELEGKGPNARIEGASDLLVAACAAVVGRDPKTRALLDPITNAPIAPGELPENVLRFDEALAERLQMDVPAEVKRPGRYIIRHLFSPRAAVTNVYDGDLSLISTSSVVFGWLNGAEVKLDEELAGE